MVTTHEVSENQRAEMISEAAYFLAEHRGFIDGDPVGDWLQAEVQVDTWLGESRHIHDRLEEQLAIINGRLKTARGKVAKLKADVRKEWERDIQKLAKLRDGFQERLVELREHSAHASEKTRQQLENLWDEAGDLLHRLESRVIKHGSD